MVIVIDIMGTGEDEAPAPAMDAADAEKLPEQGERGAEDIRVPMPQLQVVIV